MRTAWLWAVAALVLAGTAPAQVPDKVLKDMDFLVGEWEGRGKVGADDVTGTWEARWAPGRTCLLLRASWLLAGKWLEASGVSGWDPEKKQVVEYWYGQDGNPGVYRFFYGPDKDPSAWAGTSLATRPDGPPLKGQVRLERLKDAFRFQGTETIDGKEVKTDIMNRKVRPEDGQKALRDFADKAVGGTWVCDHPKAGRVEHTYDWKIPGHVLECVQKGGDGPRVMTVALDPVSNRMTWWHFTEGGAVQTIVARPIGQDAWRLSAEEAGPKGPRTLEARMVLKSKDEVHQIIDRAAPDPDKLTGQVEVWKRQKPGAGEPTAQDYLAFWKKYFVGDWDTRGVEGAWKGDTGAFSWRPGPNGNCMVFTGTLNGKATDPTVAGYDPRTRSWKEVGYPPDGSLLTIQYRVPLAVLRGDPKGQVLKGKGELVTPEGQILHGDNEVRIRDDDHWSVRVTNIVRDGVKLPDLGCEATRRKK